MSSPSRSFQNLSFISCSSGNSHGTPVIRSYETRKPSQEDLPRRDLPPSPVLPSRAPPSPPPWRRIVLSRFSSGGCGTRAGVASVHTGQHGYGDPYGLPGSPLHSDDTSEDASRRCAAPGRRSRSSSKSA
ncbi:hypothetical protein ACP70R_034006 [Stipagrostis hirtigluma subsp. patula]